MRERGGIMGGRSSGGTSRGQGEGPALPPQLVAEVDRAGYYPAVVTDVVQLALAGEVVRDHLVHLETTFDTDEVRRHVTVMALTDTRLVVAHVDDHSGEEHPEADTPPVAAASSESVPLRQVSSVVVSHRVVDPARYQRGETPDELVLTIGWGTLRRVDLEPATCGDPDCTADHGYTGTITGDDVSLRVSSDAEGEEAVRAAARFAHSLTAATRTPVVG